MTVSIILPYWDRKEAADKALHLLAQRYQGMPLEVVIVDDGNKVPYLPPVLPITVKVVRLPEKDKPTPQSRAWNAGVKAATHDVVVLSCIEVLHREPVLNEMFWELGRQGPNAYVLAAAWCPEERKWHCRSTEQIPFCPPGTGPSFCGMLKKELFYLAGGFDESYHDGCGYEDKDFIHRLTKAGARFIIRDDLIVIHPKTGAKIQWPPEGFARNAKLFHGKWPNAKRPVTFLCLKAGSAYMPAYVNILFDMVRRNLPAGYPGRFVCLTDDPSGLDDGIETLPLPSDLETWWGKLYMFRRDLFKDGERVVFLDLDTLIVGDIQKLADYDGEFATLRDFYHPERLGPAVIAWRAGDFAASIWEEWESQGRPRHPMGDLWWLNNLDQGRFAHEIDVLQDKMPGVFCSFKADCHPYPPKSARVVCFHGQPKPDNCAEEWVSLVWRVGGSGMAEMEAVCNTANERIEANIRAACARPVPWLDILPAHDRQAVIVAGGPSLKDTLGEIVWRESLGQTIIAVNGAAAWLNEREITPDIHVIIDARPENAQFLSARSFSQFIASQCAPETFEAARNATLFHMNLPGVAKLLPNGRPAHLISSGTTVGLAAMAVAYTQGFRAIHLYGFDSSYTSGHHAYPQTQNDSDAVVEVIVEGKAFKAAPWMVKQAQQFQELAAQLVAAGVVITVAGDGLLPFIAHHMAARSS